MQHDHNILLEEVQSLNESVNQLTGQRNQLMADLEEMEPVCQQHEALQLEYNQVFTRQCLDFNSLFLSPLSTNCTG